MAGSRSGRDEADRSKEGSGGPPDWAVAPLHQQGDRGPTRPAQRVKRWASRIHAMIGRPHLSTNNSPSQSIALTGARQRRSPLRARQPDVGTTARVGGPAMMALSSSVVTRRP